MSRPITPRPPCPTCGRSMTYLRSRFCSPQCRLERDYQQCTAQWLRGDVSGGRSNGRVSNHVRRWLFERAGNKCEQCGWSRVHPVTGHIPLAVHHKDGNSENNRPENLELLCGGCHMLTPNYGILNHGRGRTRAGEKSRLLQATGM
jgi:5-methylcytosine-specific restriction endonuclease McrA